MATPIILIGMNRSGTKWVSNILCSHEEVVGVQSERSRGIMETNIFGAMRDKFDLSFPDEYIGFVELWAATEFFKRTGVDKRLFYDLKPRPRNALEMFDVLMQEFACASDKRFWIQKTSPLRAPAVLEHFADARIVIVRRKLLDTLRSTLGLQKQYGRRRMVRSTFAYVRQRKVLDRIARTYDVVEMDYDRLRANRDSETERLFRELKLDPGRISGAIPYSKNTSFSSNKQRKQIMTPVDRVLVLVASNAFRLLPLWLITATSAAKERFLGRHPIPLMSGTFGDLFDLLEDKSRG